jgi:Fic family protein
MKIPEKPRPIKTIFEEKLSKGSGLSPDEGTLRLVKRYNEEYIHWDELRRKSLPVDPEYVWALIKLSRASQSKHFGIADIALTYNITSHSQRIIHLLDTGASGLLVLEEPLKGQEMERYIIGSLMEEAIASSQLEGAVTTTKAAKRMLRENRKPRSHSEQMIVNDYATMQRLKEIKDGPLTTSTILELHKLITHDTLEDPTFEGRFRMDDETVVADPFETDMVYHRPTSYEKVPQYMEQLCIFANEESGTEFHHPLIKAIVLHFMIGFVHPFVDGNGRLARALMYWYGLKKNYWLFEYMAISKAIKESRGRYGAAYLFTETDENDATYFINYNLECMERALENTRDYIARKQKEQRAAMKLIEAHPELNFRQAEILKDLIKRKGETTTVMEIASKFNVVQQTARTDLQFLSVLGFLEEKRIGKKAYYKYIGDSFAKANPQDIPPGSPEHPH